jgi:dTDP-4-dehydrorhamnose reductase
MHKVLVLGGSGLVGRAIINEMNKCKSFQIYATYFENPVTLYGNKGLKLNIQDEDNINNILDILKPQSVISCLRGDYDKQLILHTRIAEHLKKSHGKLYFCSTTNVFDNDLSKPHYEEAITNSCTDYGQYKIECEKKIIEILHEGACILRLPEVWGKESKRMKNILMSLRTNEKILVYPKLIINTNTDVMIAKKITFIIEHKLKGIFHIATEDVINHSDFYNKLIMGLGFDNIEIEEDFEEQGYFALLSKRNNEFSKNLSTTNKSVINYLSKL